MRTKQKLKDKKSRSWVFTYYFTKEEADLLWFKNLSTSSQIRYMVMGREHCPTTGRLHFQGYISYNNGKTMAQTKKWFQLDKIYVFPAGGDDFQNQTYCSKENKLLEIGEPLKQGKRSDISHAISILKDTSSMSSVLEKVHNYQACRHGELWLKYKEAERPRNTPIEIIWIYGKPRSGKTTKVYDDNKDASGNDVAIFKPLTYKWWEGYDGHKIVLIDDIRREWCTFVELLKITDRYPFRVETKGGSRQVQFIKLYITSIQSPQSMWNGYTNEPLEQLIGRITQTINIDEI